MCMSASNEIKGKSEVLGHKYSLRKLVANTVIQDCVCDSMHKQRLPGIRYVNDKAEGAT